MKIGIIGLPNVGKSTLFTALTKKQVARENYPFCTIEPNIGIVAVPDARLQALAKTFRSAQIIPTTIKFVDIAGLVKNAHKGEGLGNKFLAQIKEVDAICQVVRAFKNEDVPHVAGRINPLEDIEIVNLELAMADLEAVIRSIDNLAGPARCGDKEAQKKLSLLGRIQSGLEQGQPASRLSLEPKELIPIKDLNLLTLKPLLYIFNTDDETLKSNWLLSAPSLNFNIQLEAELADLAPMELKEYLRELNLADTGLNKLIKKAYQLLDLITFFTMNQKEVRARTLPRGTPAPQAAGGVHSDIETGFIKAEVINWQALIKVGSWSLAKEQGLIGAEGKDYIIQDGDVCYFRFKL